MMKQLREFWMQSHLCDVVIKSDDGREHRGHRNVISAASGPLKALLNGSFTEGEQISRGGAVDIAASGDVVGALIDHIYGGEPTVNTADAMELLRLAGAYGLTDLVAEIESELQDSLDSSTALLVLQQIHTLGLTVTDLRQACEEQIAQDFESCVKEDSFKALGKTQLARILAREDLWVAREEVVLDALFTWITASADRNNSLGLLLQHIDFSSLSMQNLEELSMYSQSLGPNGFELQYSVDEAKQMRLTRWWREDYHDPRRHCLHFWSPELGAFPEGYRGGQWVAGEWNRFDDDEDEMPGNFAMNFCWHQGNFYIADGKRLTRWNPSVRQFLTIVPDLPDAAVAISPAGHIFLADSNNSKLLMLQNGQLEVVLQMRGLRSVCCSSSGKLYLLGCTDQNLGWVVRLEGSETVHVISSQDLFSKFRQVSVFVRMFVQEEDLYIVGWHMEDDSSDFVLKVTPDGKTEVVGRGDGGDLRGLFVTESRKIYVADAGPVGQVLTYNPGDRNSLRVFDNAPFFWGDKPVDVLVHEGDLYVLFQTGLVYKYAFPPTLDLNYGIAAEA